MTEPLHAKMTHIVLFSGGMDSFTLLNLIWQRAGRFDRVYALSFDYGQRHKRELAAASLACHNLPGVRHLILEMPILGSLAVGSSLTDNAIPVPHGHYAAENMKLTVVPGRNTVFLAYALAFAQGLQSGDPNEAPRKSHIYIAAHSGDHAIYPDCRPEYLTAMARAIDEASESSVQLIVPFMDMSKSEILDFGLRGCGLNPERYADTHTCYEGGERPCGKCGACVERAEAFAYCDVADPLLA